MLSTRKRLTVINDGFAKSKKPAKTRLKAVINRYVKSMCKKGWTPFLRPAYGNAFAKFEAYVYMVKPHTELEKTQIPESAIKSGWILINGVYQLPEGD